MRLPNAYIVQTEEPQNSFLVYGELNSKGFAGKGFRLEVPNLHNAGNALKNDLFMRLSGWLASQGLNKRIQIRYTRDADYRDILEKYRDDTEKSAEDAWSKRIRTENYHAFMRKIASRQLYREYVYIYFSRELRQFISSDFMPEQEQDRRQFEREVVTAFEADRTELRQFLNLPVVPLDHIALFREYYRAVNKSAFELDIDYKNEFEADLSKIYLCEYAKTSRDPGTASFHSDGYFHNIFTLHDFPKSDLTPFAGNRLLGNDIQNLTIAVNIEPLDTEKVIEQKQKHWRRVRADLLEEESEVAASAGLDELTEHIYRLGKGEDSPFRIEYVIHTWNKDAAELQSDSMILRQAATSMLTSLDSYELGLQSMHNFLKTLPGYTWYKRHDAALDCMHRPLAAMLPFSCSFVGKGAEGNILFGGDHCNLMTFSFFDGDTPQHTLCLGQTGSGKSVNFVSILSQAYYQFAKVVIIEEGGSYYNLTQIRGNEAQYIVIDPNANQTLNYFDTGGLPLTPGQLEFVTAFLTAMCGESSDLEVIQDRTALISPFVAAVYTDAYVEWRNRNREGLEQAARMALSVEKLIPSMPIDRNTALDAWIELRDALAAPAESPDEARRRLKELYKSWTIRELNDYIIEDSEMLRNISYAYMAKSDMPYHSQLVEALRETSLLHLDRSDLNRVAARLAVYSVESGKGSLFDGETTVDLGRRWVHIELGKIAQSGSVLRNLVGIVINNLVMNQIINMPRGSAKLYLFEELARLLATVPGAAEIVKQSYAQLRKYKCVAVTITQSAAQMTQSGVGQIVMTQSKQFLFLHNTDAAELRLITNYVPLSEDAQQNIRNFPTPEHLPPGRKFSSFLLVAQRAGWPLCGVGRNYASSAVLAAAATSGGLHSRLERLMKELQAQNAGLPFAGLLLRAMEIATVDNTLFSLLDRIEKLGNEQIKSLVIDARIEFNNLIRKGTLV